jgi:hypothetical protein
MSTNFPFTQTSSQPSVSTLWSAVSQSAPDNSFGLVFLTNSSDAMTLQSLVLNFFTVLNSTDIANQTQLSTFVDGMPANTSVGIVVNVGANTTQNDSNAQFFMLSLSNVDGAPPTQYTANPTLAAFTTLEASLKGCSLWSQNILSVNNGSQGQWYCGGSNAAPNSQDPSTKIPTWAIVVIGVVGALLLIAILAATMNHSKNGPQFSTIQISPQ